LSIHIYT